MSCKDDSDLRKVWDPFLFDITMTEMDEMLEDIEISRQQWEAVLQNLKKIRAFIFMMHYRGFMPNRLKVLESYLLHSVEQTSQIMTALFESAKDIQKKRELVFSTSIIE